MRNAGDAARLGGAARAAGAGGAGAVKRLLDFPRVAAEAAERRGPQAIPTYAIRVADDFHRFYHHHRVLGSGEWEPFRLALVRRDARGRARGALDLVGVEAPERM